MGAKLGLLVGTVLLLARAGFAQEPEPRGKPLYDKYCSQCHGLKGDGIGIATPHLKPKPRDFTQGKYKVRTTPTGVLPTDDDLKRVIRNGMPYTGMPGWSDFSGRDLTAIVEYIKGFYDGFASATDRRPIEIPDPPPVTEESIFRGKVVYQNMGCARCHGEQGRGDGSSAPTLADDWGYHLPAADFTQPWTFIGGSTRKDIYRTFMTGLGGTPMPSYADEGALAVEDRWPLVDYVLSTASSREPRYASYVQAIGKQEALELEKGTELFDGVPAARFPMIGQIVQPGRNFYPATTSVEVRAVYNNDDIAILVEWNDMSADTAGNNDPAMETARFDPEKALEADRVGPAGGSGAQTTDPFADPFAAPQTPAPAAAEEPEADEPRFSDAVAIQLPTRLPAGDPGGQKPYFLLGTESDPVDVLFLDLGRNKAQRYRAYGSENVSPGEGSRFEAVGSYHQGRWSVIFKRERLAPTGVPFRQPNEVGQDEETFVPIAFSVWDGFSDDHGNRRALTNWYYVHLEPMQQPSPFGPMVQNFSVVFIGLVAIVFFLRRSRKGNGKEESV